MPSLSFPPNPRWLVLRRVKRLEKHTERHKRNPMDLFRASVQTWPEVLECAALTGDTLLKHPSVQDCKTSFVLDRVKATTAVPL